MGLGRGGVSCAVSGGEHSQCKGREAGPQLVLEERQWPQRAQKELEWGEQAEWEVVGTEVTVRSFMVFWATWRAL